jgi:hypothetical protein
MDNPQHYQPLSYALHQPQAATPRTKPSSSVYNQNVAPATNHREEEEEEEEADDDEDEGLVEEQLNEDEPENNSASNLTPEGQPSACVHTSMTRIQLTVCCSCQ